MNSSPPEPSLLVQDLAVSFADKGGRLEVLKDISFSLAKNEFVCMIGPSGCGKSTLLRTIAGLIPYSQGRIEYPDLHGRQARTGLIFRSQT